MSLGTQPPGTPSPGASLIAQEADKIEQLIGTARRLLAEQRLVDLSALEGRVQTLCEAVGEASEDDVADAQQRIKSVMSDLDVLEEAILARSKSVNTQLAATNRDAASKAYGSPAKPKPTLPPKDET